MNALRNPLRNMHQPFKIYSPNMPFNSTEQEKINLAWQGFLMKRRPPGEIRHQVDIDMKIDGYSIEIFTIRPRWDKPDEIIHSPIAKTTFDKSKNHWKLFWMRANLKWYG